VQVILNKSWQKSLKSPGKSTLKKHLLVKLQITCHFKHGRYSNHLKYLLKY